MNSSLEILSQQPSAQIEVKSDLFASLSIWTETTEVPNYPRLFRRLKTNGASVLHFAKDANFIIVNSSSTEGQKVVRNWANDTSKICLDFAWIQRSIDAGRPLLESDNWGDCRQVDDGQSVLDDETEEYQHANPPLHMVTQLPTPRPTPTTSTLMTVPSNSSSPTFQCDSQLPSVSTQPTANSGTVATPVPQLIPPSFFSQIAASPFPPSAFVVPFGQPFSSPTASDLLFLQQSQAFNTQLQQQQQHPASIQTQSLSQSPHLTLSQVYQQLLQAVSQQQRTVAPVHQEASLFGTPHLLTPQSTRQNLSQDPSVQNTTHIVGFPLPTTLVSTLNPLRSREDSPIVITPKLEDLPARSRSALDRTEPAIFEERIGAPLKFLVQIDLKNRAQVTKAIKRHGGRIIPAVSDADFAILSSRGSDYHSLRREADFNSVPVLTPSFIIDCEEKKRFLSTGEYSIPPTEAPSTRGRSRKSIAGTTETKSAKSNPYTPGEREEFIKYVKRFIKKAPDIKASYLASLLHTKMPSHSLNSWLWFCSQNKPLIEDIRRKVQHKHALKDDNVKLIEIGFSSDKPSPSSSSSLFGAGAVRSKLEPCEDILSTNEDVAGAKQDFDFVREFFASGAGDSGLEDEVWLAMTNRKTCKTAKTWREFCNHNWERIVKEQKEFRPASAT